MQIESTAYYVKGQQRTPVIVKSDATYNSTEHQFYFLVANRSDGRMFTARAEEVVLAKYSGSEAANSDRNSDRTIQDVVEELNSLSANRTRN